MTEDKMALLTLPEQRGGGDFVRELVGLAAEQLMEVEARTGSAKGERPAQRRRDRTWETRAGYIDPAIPKLRKGPNFPNLP